MNVSDIKRALTRKFGPLPAWAWALVGGLGLYLYRRRAGGATTATSTTGQVVDSTATPGPPLQIGAGDSVYDPATGKLLGAAPDPGMPVTLQPGESVYDPNTGKVSPQPPDPQTTPAPPPGKPAFGGRHGRIQGPKGGFIQLANGSWIGRGGRIFKSKPFGVRKAKTKGQHVSQNAVKPPSVHTGAAKGRPRSNGATRTSGHKAAPTPAHQGRPRPTPSPGPKRNQRNRATDRAPVVRAHPHTGRR